MWCRWTRSTRSVTRSTQADAGRRVAVSGSFDGSRQLLVVDRLGGGQSGAWVLTAFALAETQGVTVPVVRGWLPEGEPPPAPPEGEVRLEGWLEPSEPTTLRESGRDPLPQGQVEIVSSPELLSLWTPAPLLQGFVIVDEPAPDVPLRPVAPPALNTDSEVDWQNLAYAIQWWLFGAVRDLLVRSHDAGGGGGPSDGPGRADPEALGTIEATTKSAEP